MNQISKATIIYLALFISNKSLCQTWTRIKPVQSCPDFTIEYSINSNKGNEKKEYLLRINGDSNQVKINNHKSFLEEMKKISDSIKEKCQEEKGILKTEENCYQESELSQDFRFFLGDISKNLINQPEMCNGHVEYLELYQSLQGLNSSKLKRTRDVGNKILKIFAGKENAHLLDLYESCGGKKGKEDFITNLIMIEGYNQCIIPSPPGMITAEVFRGIASDIAKEYKELNLIELKSKYKDIEKKIMIMVANEYAATTVSKNLNLDIKESKSIIDNLASKKRLDIFIQSNPQNIKDYLNFVYSPDLTVEIGRIALAPLLKNSLKEKLNSLMSEKEQDQFITQDLLPEVYKNFDECTSEIKIKSSYQVYQDPHKNLKERIKLKDKFCTENPKIFQCLNVDPNEKSPQNCIQTDSINLLSMNKDISDESAIKNCGKKSFAIILKSVLDKLIELNLKDLTEITLENKQNIQSKGWNIFKTCMNGKKEIFNEDNSIVTKQIDQVSVEEFEKIIGDCGLLAKKGITEQVVSHVFLSNPSVKDYFESLKSKNPSESGADEFSQKHLPIWLNDCFSSQIQNGINENELDPLKCESYIETQFGKILIKDSLKEALNLEDDHLDSNPVVQNYTSCADKAIKSILIQTTKQGPKTQNFLEENHEYMNCAKEAILESAEVIAEIDFRKTLSKTKDISNPKKYNYLIKKVKSTVKTCTEKNLSAIESWDKLKIFQETNGITKLKNDCTSEVLLNVVPEILVSELKEKLESLKNSLPPGETIESILLKISQKLVKDKPSENPVTNLRRAFASLLKKNSDTAIANLTDLIFSTSIDSIKSSYLDLIIQEGTKKGLDLSELKTKITNECVLNLQNAFDENPQTVSKDEKIKITQLIDIIIDGFHYSSKIKPSVLSQQINAFEKFCEKSSSIKDSKSLKELLKQSKIADSIIKSQYQKKFISIMDEKFYSFISSIEERELLKIRLGSISLKEYDSSVAPFFKRIKDDYLTLKRNFLKSPNEFNKLMFSAPNGDVIIHSIIDGFPDILNEKGFESDNSKIIISKSIEQLFSNKISNGFANTFSKSLIVNLSGALGYQDASVFEKPFWTVNKIDESMNWQGRSYQIQEKYINLIKTEILNLTSNQGEETDFNKLADGIKRDFK